ncbi:MAG: hypothetical protein WCQ57_10280, partial [Verrucomicrobiota bacterium]
IRDRLAIAGYRDGERHIPDLRRGEIRGRRPQSVARIDARARKETAPHEKTVHHSRGVSVPQA